MPVGETTPIAPARMSSGSQLVNAKTMPASDHQRGAGDEDPAPAEPVGVGGQPERDDRVADERQGQHDPDRQRVEPGRREVEDEDDRQEPVAEHAQRPHREQQPAVTVEATETGDEAGIDGRRGRGGHAGDSSGDSRRRLPECAGGSHTAR